jgi:uncharacterized tellurite resistance protein B-like protein
VKVRWSGILMTRTPGRESELRAKSISTQVYTLIRKQNVQTSPAGTFSSAGCPKCGAPLQVSDTGGCEYCGAILTNGDYEWVLDSVDRFTEDMAREHFSSLDEQRSLHPDHHLSVHATDTPLAISILAQAALLDGVLDEKERKYLQQLGAHRGLTPQQVDDVIEQARAMDTRLPKPASTRQAQAYISQLVHVFLVDGTLSRGEEQMLVNYADFVGLTPADVKMAIRKEKSRVYQASKKPYKELTYGKD